MYLPCRDFPPLKGPMIDHKWSSFFPQSHTWQVKKVKLCKFMEKKEERLGRREERGYFLRSGFCPAALPSCMLLIYNCDSMDSHKKLKTGCSLGQ